MTSVLVAVDGSENSMRAADIAGSVEIVLQWTTSVPKDRIKVMVEQGWVTLSGEVNWDYQRQDAARGVRHLAGVTGVSDQIAIKPKVSLGAVKSDIEAALKRRAHADAQKISVEIHGSDVTLSGTVHSWSERAAARHSAWGSPGVHNVVDHMTIVS